MVKVLNMLEKLGFVQRTDEAREIAAEINRPAAPAEPPPPEIRTVPSVEFDQKVAANTAGAEKPEDFPFSKIYESAGVSDPEHGFTVFALIEMMEAAEFEALDDATRANVIRGLLRSLPSGAVELQDIIEDAARRDQALDAFERFLAGRVDQLAQELDLENEALQLEIDELTIKNSALIDKNRERVDEEKNRLDGWQQRKRREEERLFEAVRPFATDNPVTRTDDSIEASSPTDANDPEAG